MAREFVDLKRTKAEKKAREESYKLPSPDGEDYPYGLNIRLSQEELTKLGIKELPEAGDEIMLEAVATVISTSNNERNGKSDRSIELQLRKLCLDIGGEPDDESEESAERTRKAAKGAMDAALSGMRKR